METVREEIDVRPPSETVFSRLKDASETAAFMPHLTRVRTIEECADGGWAGTYSGRILGFPLTGELQTVDYRENSRIVWRLEGDLSGTVRWYVKSVSPPAKTRCTIAVTYRSVGPTLFRSVLDRVLQARTKRQVKSILKRVKLTVENGTRTDSNV